MCAHHFPFLKIYTSKINTEIHYLNIQVILTFIPGSSGILPHLGQFPLQQRRPVRASFTALVCGFYQLIYSISSTALSCVNDKVLAIVAVVEETVPIPSKPWPLLQLVSLPARLLWPSESSKKSRQKRRPTTHSTHRLVVLKCDNTVTAYWQYCGCLLQGITF